MNLGPAAIASALTLALSGCLRSILDYFSDSCQRHTRWHAFVGCCIEVGQGLKRGSFALHVGNKIFAVLIFANGSWLAKNMKINTSQKLPTIRYMCMWKHTTTREKWYTEIISKVSLWPIVLASSSSPAQLVTACSWYMGESLVTILVQLFCSRLHE